MNLKKRMNSKSTQGYLKIISSVFQYLLIIYLIILLIDQYFPIKFLNLNYLLVTVIVLGVITISFFKPEKEKKHKITRKDKYLIYFLGILGAILIYLKTKEIGWISYLISIIGGALIIIISKLFLEEENGKDN